MALLGVVLSHCDIDVCGSELLFLEHKVTAVRQPNLELRRKTVNEAK